jgi:hypothetical protein
LNHQPEAQHPKSPAIHKLAGRLPHLPNSATDETCQKTNIKSRGAVVQPAPLRVASPAALVGENWTEFSEFVGRVRGADASEAASNRAEHISYLQTSSGMDKIVRHATTSRAWPANGTIPGTRPFSCRSPAVASYPSERFTLRNGIMIVRQHDPAGTTNIARR